MYLADVACRSLGFSEDERVLVTTAGLLHDIGHGPFSHASEPLLEEYLRRTHDDISGIVHEQAGSILRKYGIDADEVCAVVRGEHPLAGVIHGDLDVDRMDYLLRDAYYTGAPYGTVDAQRLIRNMIRTDEGFVLDENGINAAESLLIARTLMRPAVYYHHVSRIGESMFHLAALEHLRVSGGDALELLTKDDAACMQILRTSESLVARDLITKIYERRLYKRALYVGVDQVNAAAYQAGVSLEKNRAIATGIAEAAGVEPESVLLDIPPFPSDMSMGVRVRNQHMVVSFDQLSPRIRTLNETRHEQWRLGVYSPRELCDTVMDAAAEILHVRKPTRQDTLF
jgi:HD superfamily phosphohydrolase